MGNIVNEIYKEENVEIKEEIAVKIEFIKEENEDNLDF